MLSLILRKPSAVPKRSLAIANWRHARSWRFLLPSAVVAAALAVLFLFPPQHWAFYPRCSFLTWTGWQCPGCGGLRAAHELLHGRLNDAFHLNPLFILLLPVAILFGVYRLWRFLRMETEPDFLPRPMMVWFFVLAMIVFAVLRNAAALHG